MDHNQGLCIIRESCVAKATPFVMLEHSEASQGGASQLQKKLPAALRSFVVPITRDASRMT